MAADQKNARERRASLIFADESGLLLLPLVRRTLADLHAIEATLRFHFERVAPASGPSASDDDTSIPVGEESAA